MVYIGVDLHRKKSQVAAIDEDGTLVLNRKVRTGPRDAAADRRAGTTADPGCVRSNLHWTPIEYRRRRTLIHRASAIEHCRLKWEELGFQAHPQRGSRGPRLRT